MWPRSPPWSGWWPLAEEAAAPRTHSRHLPDALGRRYLLEFDTAELASRRADVLVIGSGMAGLTAALGAAANGRTVHLVTKGRPTFQQE